MKRAGWIALLFAVAVTALHTVLLHLGGGCAWPRISGSLADSLNVLLMLCAWRVHDRDVPLALLLGTVAGVVFYLRFFVIGDGLVWHLFGLAVMIGPAAVWSIRLMVRGKTESGKAARSCGAIWDAWLACAALAVAVEIVLCQGTYFFYPFFTRSCWASAAKAAMPILYAWVLRWLVGKSLRTEIGLAVYYALCLLTVWLFGYGLFGLIMPVWIGVSEFRSAGRKIRAQAALSVGYAAAWASLCFFRDRRVREIVFDLGGPAVNIKPVERVNWLGYKLAAMKCYFTGNTDVFSAVSGLPHETRPGFWEFISDDSLGALTYRFGWPWLLVMTVLVAAATFLLIKSGRKERPTTRRDMWYMGIAWLLRALVSLFYILTMTPRAGGDFPFQAANTMDLLMLGVLLWRCISDGLLTTGTGRIAVTRCGYAVLRNGEVSFSDGCVKGDSSPFTQFHDYIDIQGGFDYVIGLRKNGSVVATKKPDRVKKPNDSELGNNGYCSFPNGVRFPSGIKQIAAAEGRVAAIDERGNLFHGQANALGQADIKNPEECAEAVSVGFDTLLYIDKKRRLMLLPEEDRWGQSLREKLREKMRDSGELPVQCKIYNPYYCNPTAGVLTNRQHFIWCCDCDDEAVVFPGSVVRFSMGDSIAAVITNHGKVFLQDKKGRVRRVRSMRAAVDVGIMHKEKLVVLYDNGKVAVLEIAAAFQ